ncbi:MAG: hypothetical protein ACI93R_000815 [Flavobacteriales bacterium]
MNIICMSCLRTNYVILTVSIVLFGLLLSLESQSDDSPHPQSLSPLETFGMDLSVQEISAISSSINSARQVSKISQTKNSGLYRRDAHAKATGCVRAKFIINGDIPDRFQHSVFSSPTREYQAWVRFSNGDMLVQADDKPDARGMAIKVMGVEGDKIAPELKGAATQDFVMTNTPAFFNRNIMDYADDLKYLAKLQRTRWFISLWPPRIHPKQFLRAVQTVSAKITTPLAPQYFSMLPYQLAHIELKFSVKPCGIVNGGAADTKSANYLSQNLQQQLRDDSACFDFMLQERKAGADMPLDDATAIWSEDTSPFIPVARVHIPVQDFLSEEQSSFCENLSMNPWHGVGEWQPMGSLNKARRVVYAAVSKYRHSKNSQTQFQPVNWCLNESGICDDEPNQPLSSISRPKPCFDANYKPVDGQGKTGQACDASW